MYKKIITDDKERKDFLENICTMAWNERAGWWKKYTRSQ